MLPTPAGKILLRYAQDIIKLRDEAVQALRKFKGELSGGLVIGASTIPGTYFLPRFIGSFKTRYPSIQITLKISDSADVVDRLLDGTVEIGLIGAKPDDRRILLEEIFSDELLLVVYPGHPWATRDEIDLPELEEEPFILRERGSGTRLVMARFIEAAGFDPAKLNPVAEMGSTEAVRQGIKARIGISIISSQAVAEDIERGTLVAVPLRDRHFSRSFYLVQRKKRQISPLCAAFLDHLRSTAGEGDVAV